MASSIANILSRYGLLPDKSLGQNFLVDEGVVKRLVDAAELTYQDVVMEIGPGVGTITKVLASRVGKVLAVEKDNRFIPVLKHEIHEAIAAGKVHVICADVLDYLGIEFPNWIARQASQRYKVVGAIPYNITSPLVHRLLMLAQPPELMVMIIQKEVADKIVAQPPHGSYLSIFVQSLTEVELMGKSISSGAFWPRPKVNSQVIKFRPRNWMAITDIRKWGKFLHHGFRNPRKMINKSFSLDLLAKAKIEPTVRPQELKMDDWRRLFVESSSL